MNDLTRVPPRAPAAAEGPFGWLRTEIDRLFDDFGRPGRSIFQFGTAGFGPVPAVEMIEQDKDYRLTAELPGLKDDDVEISIAEGMLKISGEKREEAQRKEDGVLLSERRYGSFERRVALPSEVDADAITAEFKKGVLTVTLPKDPAAGERGRKIAITSKS